MLKNLSEMAIRIFLSSLVIVMINMVGMQYNFSLPINLFNIGIIAGFGLPGLVVAVLLKYFIG